MYQILQHASCALRRCQLLLELTQFSMISFQWQLNYRLCQDGAAALLGELFFRLATSEARIAGARCQSGRHISVALVEVAASWAGILLPYGRTICIRHHNCSVCEARAQLELQ